MPRSLVRDPEAERAKILFPDDTNMAAVARAANIPVSTLSRYRRDVSGIKLDMLRKIVKARGLTDEEIVRIIRR